MALKVKIFPLNYEVVGILLPELYVKIQPARKLSQQEFFHLV
jgi:hypothetical protein